MKTIVLKHTKQCSNVKHNYIKKVGGINVLIAVPQAEILRLSATRGTDIYNIFIQERILNKICSF